jgi:bifunctional ADP-heptose synthase (sugar kinase/adenylyltransferase)
MKQFLEEFKKKYSYNEVMNYLEDIKNLKILIIGETIIDEYQYGVTLGKSGKDPIVAFQENELETYPGGVLAIYNHLKDFVTADYYTSKEAIIKRRFLQDKQKLFETYSVGDNRMYKELNNNISDYDIVIAADFGHGFIERELRNKIQEQSNYLVLNAQYNAGNIGLNTIRKYKKMNYVSITDHELRLALSNQFDTVEDILNEYFKDKNIILSITLGRSGSFVYHMGNLIKIPALIDRKDVKDTTGAGDAYLSISTPLAYKKAPIDIIGFFGNVAGAIACSYPGNKESVNRDKIEKYIRNIYEIPS